MLSFWRSIPTPIKVVSITILVLAFIAVYQWGYINGKQSK